VLLSQEAARKASAMMERKWTVRPYQPEDVDSLQELYTLVFREPRPAQHLVWKYSRNPAGSGLSMVAELSGQMVGHYGMMPTWLRIGKQVVLGVQACEAMTHPDFRNQGISIALARAGMDAAIAKGVEAGYGLAPLDKSYHGLVARLNWDHVTDIPCWARVLNANVLKGRFRRIRHLVSLGLNFLPSGNRTPGGVEIRDEKPSDEEMVSLAELTSSREKLPACSVQRSVDWFKWRFDSESKRSYVWSSAYRDGKLEAWAAFGINEWGEMPLIDMNGSDPKSLEAVVSAATRQARKLGVSALFAYTSDQNMVRALKSCGYLRHGSIPLVVRQFTLRTLDANIHVDSSWHITSQDFDTF